jgi:hypothetical protein
MVSTRIRGERIARNRNRCGRSNIFENESTYVQKEQISVWVFWTLKCLFECKVYESKQDVQDLPLEMQSVGHSGEHMRFQQQRNRGRMSLTPLIPNQGFDPI